jgi:hypothetical protein
MPAEYEPTDAQRSLVENAAAFGLTQACFSASGKVASEPDCAHARPSNEAPFQGIPRHGSRISPIALRNKKAEYAMGRPALFIRCADHRDGRMPAMTHLMRSDSGGFVLSKGGRFHLVPERSKGKRLSDFAPHSRMVLARTSKTIYRFRASNRHHPGRQLLLAGIAPQA